MNGIDLCVLNADNSALGLGYSPPFPTGLAYWGFLGGSEALSTRNYANDNAPGVALGAPVYGTGYARLGADASGIETTVSETNEMTIIAVFRSTDTLADTAHRPTIVSNNAGQSLMDPSRTAGGTAIYQSSAGKLGLRCPHWNGTSSLVGLIEIDCDVTQWGYVEARFGGGERFLRHRTQNKSLSSPTSSTRDPADRKFRIGASASVSEGLCDVAFLAIWYRKLTDAELDAAYAQVRAVCAFASRGGLLV